MVHTLLPTNTCHHTYCNDVRLELINATLSPSWNCAPKHPIIHLKPILVHNIFGLIPDCYVCFYAFNSPHIAPKAPQSHLFFYNWHPAHSTACPCLHTLHWLQLGLLLALPSHHILVNPSSNICYCSMYHVVRLSADYMPWC